MFLKNNMCIILVSDVITKSFCEFAIFEFYNGYREATTTTQCTVS